MANKSRKSAGSRKASSAAKPRPSGKKMTAVKPKPRKGSIPTAAGAVETTHNSQGSLQLTEEQGMALHHRHTEEYKKALDKKKKTDADFKNACKVIKAEGGSLTLIKMQLMEPEVLERHIRDTVGEFRTIADYNAMPIGGQLELLDKPDRTPGDERAFKAGRVVGMQGGDRTPPYASNLPQASRWLQGYDEGQDVLRETLKKKTAAKSQPETTLVKASSRKKANKQADLPAADEPENKEPVDRGASETWLDEEAGATAAQEASAESAPALH